MALYGVEHFMPGFQEKLILARRSMRGWTNLRPPHAHPPITYGLTCVVAAELSRMGHPGAGLAALNESEKAKFDERQKVQRLRNAGLLPIPSAAGGDAALASGGNGTQMNTDHQD